ncbi:MAG: V-type ATP synthase subunit F [Candidatus Thermoplasmatota archaeon]|nr:V-type ATP synthase subunit F [Candidatus Thermoplasmatota archaeon]MBU1941801.1 V-type ATP synthase subunit F [Candidatus Thermoplasmatota archaeon]
MKLAAICDKDTAMGLRLAGIQHIYAPPQQILPLLEKITKEHAAGVIFITEAIAEQFTRDLKDYRMIHHIPIIVEIPDKTGHKPDHIDFISHLIKRAVGIDVSKK